MGLFDKLRGELVDIIEWLDDSQHTLVWRFPRYQNEIKNGAQLIVRPGQVAVFVHEGKLADVFPEGRHVLSTSNLPILSTLQGWKYGFDSPFRCEVYFVRTSQVTDLKWGTPNPIILRDADFGPVRVRAFGTYALKALDPKILVRELVGTDGNFGTDAVAELLRSIITRAFADMLGEAQVPVMDLAARYHDLSEALRKKTCEMIDDEYGLQVPVLNIVNISLPESVEKAIDQRSAMGALGDMQRFQQYQMANAMTAAATAPGGGGAAEGMGLGMGLAMAQQMMRGMQPGGFGAPGMAAPGMAPPPPPPMPTWHVSVNGVSQGPFSPEQLAQGIAAGQVRATTMVWCQGMAQWQPAASVPQLAPYFQGPPPPPPPPPPAG